MYPKRFHRKESLFPNDLPHRSLRELLSRVAPGDYSILPSKGRGRMGTAIRVWRRHVNVADRMRRRREIKALWRLGVRDVLGDQAAGFTFLLVEHEAYMIYYCIGASLPLSCRRVPIGAACCALDLDDKSLEFVAHARDGWYPELDFSPL